MSALEIVFWDVQHGNAIYIKTPNSKHIVQDLGTGSIGTHPHEFSPLFHLRYNYQIDKLSAVIVTHPHKDHIDDIIHLDEFYFPVFHRPRHLSKEDILRDVRDRDRILFDEYFEYDQKYVHSVASENKLTNPDNFGGVNIQIFSPKSCNSSNLNNHSLVTVMSYAGSKIILPGDNEAPSWRELLEWPSFLSAISDADILLAAHHGREAGYCADIFRHFKPKLTIISDGPTGGTSASAKYSNVSKGWTVHKRYGGHEERSCLTTRKDGVIVVKFGYDLNNDRFI